MDSLIADSYAPSVTWLDRLDPMNELKWQDTVLARWTTTSTSNQTIGIGPDGILRDVTNYHFSPIHPTDFKLYSIWVIMAMSIMHNYTKVTTYQMATLLGVTPDKAYRIMDTMYSYGLVKRLIPQWWDVHNEDVASSGTGVVWSLNRKDWSNRQWWDNLDPLSYALSANNVDPIQFTPGSGSPAALRHDLSTLDIMIKAMECIPEVVGTWGEAWAVPEFYYNPHAADVDMARNNIGDGVIVTNSGKIIVLEVSGSFVRGNVDGKSQVVEKAAAWTSICGRTELDLNVVFVEITRNGNIKRLNEQVLFGVEAISKKYVSNSRMRERGANKIFTATAFDWFPIPRATTELFRRLRVFHPYSHNFVNLIDYAEAVPDMDKDIVLNTLASLHTPWWINGNKNMPAGLKRELRHV